MACVVNALRWAVVIVDFDPVVGHEQAGQRRAVVVSYEAYHASKMATVCPISAREVKYLGEVPLPAGHAGQTKNAVILCHQIRTIDQDRITAYELGGRPQFVTDSDIRRSVRLALAHQLGLDVPAMADGAA